MNKIRLSKREAELYATTCSIYQDHIGDNPTFLSVCEDGELVVEWGHRSVSIWHGLKLIDGKESIMDKQAGVIDGQGEIVDKQLDLPNHEPNCIPPTELKSKRPFLACYNCGAQSPLIPAFYRQGLSISGIIFSCHKCMDKGKKVVTLNVEDDEVPQ